MWSFLTNPIVSHFLAGCLGAGGAWYATHKTAVKAAEASASAAVTAVTTGISTAISDAKKA